MVKILYFNLKIYFYHVPISISKRGEWKSLKNRKKKKRLLVGNLSITKIVKNGTSPKTENEKRKSC